MNTYEQFFVQEMWKSELKSEKEKNGKEIS